MSIDHEEMPRIRAGFVVPSLHYGGAERWTLELARHCCSAKIHWTGTVIASPQWVDARMLTTLSDLMPVFCDATIWDCGEQKVETSLDNALNDLLGSVDVLITWEVDRVIRSLVDQVGGSIINVAHREDLASLTKYLKPTDHLAGVWGNCRDTFGLENATRVTIIPNGIDLDRCHPVRTREVMRKLWGIADATLVVGYLGRIDPRKNCQAIARAVQALGGDAAGVIIGSSTLQTPDVESEVIQHAGGRVQLLPAIEDIGSVLAAIDVFMLPSPSEVCSLSLLEAWAAEVPVVATPVGAVPDLESEYGSLIIPINPDSDSATLAAAVRQAISETESNLAMRRRAADLVRQRFNVKRMANAWTDFFAQVATIKS